MYFQQRENLLALTIENSLGLYYRTSEKITLPIATTDWEKFGGEVVQSIIKLSSTESDALEISLKRTQPVSLGRPQLNNTAVPLAPGLIRSDEAIGRLVSQGLPSPEGKVTTCTTRRGGRRTT